MGKHLLNINYCIKNELIIYNNLMCLKSCLNLLRVSTSVAQVGKRSCLQLTATFYAALEIILFL